jgi:hypothetical protein
MMLGAMQLCNDAMHSRFSVFPLPLNNVSSHVAMQLCSAAVRFIM